MKRGSRPLPVRLKLVEGTLRADRHGDPDALRAQAEATAASYGPVAMPRYLKGEAARAWRRYIKPANWLDASREMSAVILCELWALYRRDPEAFSPAQHTVLRGHMNILGLTDERARAIGRGHAYDEFFDR